MKRALLSFAILVFVTGCYTSQHRPVMFKTDTETSCPDWAVMVEVDHRFYCVDRSAFDDPDYH